MPGAVVGTNLIGGHTVIMPNGVTVYGAVVGTNLIGGHFSAPFP